MRVEEAQKRLDEISETIKELRFHGSDIARATILFPGLLRSSGLLLP